MAQGHARVTRSISGTNRRIGASHLSVPPQVMANVLHFSRYWPSPIHRGTAFPTIDRGCNFFDKVQAEHSEAPRTKQPSRCPAPTKQLKPVTQRKGRQQ